MPNAQLPCMAVIQSLDDDVLSEIVSYLPAFEYTYAYIAPLTYPHLPIYSTPLLFFISPHPDLPLSSLKPSTCSLVPLFSSRTRGTETPLPLYGTTKCVKYALTMAALITILGPRLGMEHGVWYQKISRVTVPVHNAVPIYPPVPLCPMSYVKICLE